MTPIDTGMVLFVLAVFGSLFGFWKYIDSKLTALRAEASAGVSAATALAQLARGELADHRLHTAETYITKAGMRETTEQLMDAIHGVKTAVDSMALRVDRVVENQGKSPARARP